MGDVYNPLIEAARADDPNGHALLQRTGEAIYTNNPGLCPSVQDGLAAARRNLDYYCRYSDETTAAKVRAFYRLGESFSTLVDVKIL